MTSGTIIPGLVINPDYINIHEELQLMHLINAQPWENHFSRRVQHYGWKYHYDRRAISQDDYIGPLPDWLLNVAHNMSENYEFYPDQAIINEYKPGQKISAHIDHKYNFGPVVASLSLLATTSMKFSGQYESEWIELPRRSLLLLQDDARYLYTHELPEQSETRVSITFRTVNHPLP